MLRYKDILQQILSFITLVSFSVARCPYYPHDMKSCIASSLPNYGLGPPANESQPEALRKGIDMARESCRSDALMQGTNCMQNIIDQCQGMSENEQILQRLFNIDDIIETTKYFCSHLDIYEKHTKCITEQHPQASTCAEKDQENYQKMLTAGASIDVLILATCKYQDRAVTCLGEKVNDNCGNEAAVFLETIALGTRPPDCNEITPRYTTPAQNSPSNGQTSLNFFSLSMYLFLFVICLLL